MFTRGRFTQATTAAGIVALIPGIGWGGLRPLLEGGLDPLLGPGTRVDITPGTAWRERETSFEIRITLGAEGLPVIDRPVRVARNAFFSITTPMAFTPDSTRLTSSGSQRAVTVVGEGNSRGTGLGIPFWTRVGSRWASKCRIQTGKRRCFPSVSFRNE